jgi:hypothetical protein
LRGRRRHTDKDIQQTSREILITGKRTKRKTRYKEEKDVI